MWAKLLWPFQFVPAGKSSSLAKMLINTDPEERNTLGIGFQYKVSKFKSVGQA